MVGLDDIRFSVIFLLLVFVVLAEKGGASVLLQSLSTSVLYVSILINPLFSILLG